MDDFDARTPWSRNPSDAPQISLSIAVGLGFAFAGAAVRWLPELIFALMR